MKKGKVPPVGHSLSNVYCPVCNLLVPPGRHDVIGILGEKKDHPYDGQKIYCCDHFSPLLIKIGLGPKDIGYLNREILKAVPSIQYVMHYALAQAFMRKPNGDNFREIKNGSKDIERLTKYIYTSSAKFGINLMVAKVLNWVDYLQMQQPPIKHVHYFVPEIPCYPVRARQIFAR